ncbi:hypothetical protein HaLaN_28463, partial [Haematococcus lacustris]
MSSYASPDALPDASRSQLREAPVWEQGGRQQGPHVQQGRDPQRPGLHPHAGPADVNAVHVLQHGNRACMRHCWRWIDTTCQAWLSECVSTNSVE